MARLLRYPFAGFFGDFISSSSSDLPLSDAGGVSAEGANAWTSIGSDARTVATVMPVCKYDDDDDDDDDNDADDDAEDDDDDDNDDDDDDDNDDDDDDDDDDNNDDDDDDDGDDDDNNDDDECPFIPFHLLIVPCKPRRFSQRAAGSVRPRWRRVALLRCNFQCPGALWQHPTIRLVIYYIQM